MKTYTEQLLQTDRQ